MPQCAVQYEASGEWRLLHSVTAMGKLAPLLSLAFECAIRHKAALRWLDNCIQQLTQPSILVGSCGCRVCKL